MTVREFIDAIKTRVHANYKTYGLKPVDGEWGDGVKTACPVVALARQFVNLDQVSLLAAKKFLDTNAAMILVHKFVIKKSKLGAAFAALLVNHLPNAFDSCVIPHPPIVIVDDLPVADYEAFPETVAWVLGQELQQELAEELEEELIEEDYADQRAIRETLAGPRGWDNSPGVGEAPEDSDLAACGDRGLRREYA